MRRRLIENRFRHAGARADRAGAPSTASPTPAAPPPSSPCRPNRCRAPIAAVSTVCPDPGGAMVTAVTPPNANGAARPSSTTATTRSPWTSPASSGRRPCPPAPTSIRVHATGAMASGLEAAQTQARPVRRGPRPGGVRCVDPGRRAPGSSAPDRGRRELKLHLANVESAPADVALVVYSGEGQVIADRASGLILKPSEHRPPSTSKTVAPVAAGHGAERVDRPGPGRRRRRGDHARGASTGSRRPPNRSKRVVVPGVPGSAGRRELYVAAPGEQDAIVQIKAVLEDGSYALENREERRGARRFGRHRRPVDRGDRPARPRSC